MVAGMEKFNEWYVPVIAIATLTILIHSTLNDFAFLHRLEFKPSSLHKPPFVFMTIWNVNNMVVSALELFTLLHSLNASTDQSLSHSKWHIRGSFWLTFNEVCVECSEDERLYLQAQDILITLCSDLEAYIWDAMSLYENCPVKLQFVCVY